MSMHKYALLNQENIVVMFATEDVVNNSEKNMTWIRIRPQNEGHVRIGYRYLPDKDTFVRVRKTLFKEKMELIQKVNKVYNDKMDMLLSAYPENEIKTFWIQAMELFFHECRQHGEYGGEIVFLHALSNERGIEVKFILPRLKEKLKTFSYVAGSITGKKQRFEDEIEAAEKHDILDEIENRLRIWSE